MKYNLHFFLHFRFRNLVLVILTILGLSLSLVSNAQITQLGFQWTGTIPLTGCNPFKNSAQYCNPQWKVSHGAPTFGDMWGQNNYTVALLSAKMLNSDNAIEKSDGLYMPYNFAWDHAYTIEIQYAKLNGSVGLNIYAANGMSETKNTSCSNENTTDALNKFSDKTQLYLNLACESGSTGYFYTRTIKDNWLPDKSYSYIWILSREFAVEYTGSLYLAQIKITDNGLKSAPKPPTKVTASNITQASCTLSWAAAAGTVTGYKVYQNGVLISTTSSTSVNITGLTLGSEYTLSVSAYNSFDESAKTSTKVTTCPLAPSVPTDLSITNITNTGCTLSWTAPTGSVTGYHIYANGSLIQTASTTSATLQNLVQGASYTLTVTAYNCGGESSQSNGISLQTIPSAPTGLTAGVIVSNIDCDLSWTAPSGTISGYNIYANGSLVKTTTSTSVNVDGLTPNYNYTFQVSAYNNSGESEKSNSVSVKTRPLPAPYRLTVSNITEKGATLSWVGTFLATGYKIYQHCTPSAEYTIPANMTYTFTNLTPHTSYVFSVYAINADGESLNSNLIGFATLPLGSPTTLLASNITTSSCTLSWRAASGDVTGYFIYQNGSKVQTTSSTSITINNLTAGNTYTFTVSAYNSYGESNQSNSTSVSTITYAPTNLVASNITSSSCTLSWTAPTGFAVTGYNIYIYTLRAMTSTSTSRTFGIEPGVSYQFSVTAYNSSGESPKSNTVSFTSPSLKSINAKGHADTSQEGSIQIYPNPANDYLSVSGLKEFEADIFDAYGRKVLHAAKTASNIDISALSSGIYFIQLKGSGVNVIKKFVKE